MLLHVGVDSIEQFGVDAHLSQIDATIFIVQRIPFATVISASAMRGLGAGPRGARTTRLGRPRKSPLVSQRHSVHRIPPHVRDDAYAPDRNVRIIRLILVSEKQNISRAPG